MQRYKSFAAFCVGGMLLTACGPRYVPAETLLDGSGAAHGAYSQNYYQNGYSQAGYSQAGYSHPGYSQAGYSGAKYSATSSRYGSQAFQGQSGLRAPCNDIVAPCGFMRVVPIYPVYQVPISTEPAPVAEVPTITLPEPEPVMIVEPEVLPEPIYEPIVEHWPEPAVEMPSWQPLRK